jgi:hypothetical protein
MGDALINSLSFMKKNGMRVNIRRVLEDGDYVVQHSEYNRERANPGTLGCNADIHQRKMEKF